MGKQPEDGLTYLAETLCVIEHIVTSCKRKVNLGFSATLIEAIRLVGRVVSDNPVASVFSVEE